MLELLAESPVKDFSKPFALLVEDHPLFRKGLGDLLLSRTDLAFYVEAESISSGLARFTEHRPTIVLVDISLHQENGLQLVTKIRELDKTVPILVVSMFHAEYYAERSMKAGANGYVSKQASFEVILDAIKTVREGHNFHEVHDAQQDQALGSKNEKLQEHLHKDLSAREQQILQYLGDGKTTQAIANQLGLATSTVETYRERLKTKLQLSNSAELTRYAILWRLENP